MTETHNADTLYQSARALMETGDLAGAKSQFSHLIEASQDDHSAMRDGLAAQIQCSYAVCLRDTGDTSKADFWFRSAVIRFAQSGDEEARYVAAQADFLRGLMMRDAGDSAEARDLFDTVSMRIMMEEHPAIRSVFHAAMDELKALEAKIGPAREPAEAAAQPLTYSKIANAFEKTPRSWCFESDRIIGNRNGKSYAIPYDAVRRLHFQFAPTRPAKWRYSMTIETRQGHKEEIDNASFAGVLDFTDQSEHYRAAVAELIKRLKANGTPVEVVSGRSWFFYCAMVLLTAFFAVMFLLTLLVGGLIGFVVKLGLAALFVPTLFRWFKRNIPQRGTLDALPQGSLPL